jgi:serine phosphatase RsbU (regulator of sigma subunit)
MFSGAKIFSQNPEVDSIYKLLINHKLEDSVKIELLNSLADAVYRQDIDSAENISEEILKLSKKIKYEKGIGHFHRIKGLYYRTISDFDNALDENLKALQIYKKEKYVSGCAISYNDVGIIFIYKNDYQKALKYFRKSLILYERLYDEKKTSREFNNIALVYRETGNYDISLEYYLKAEKIAEKYNDLFIKSSIYANKGELYSLLERPKKSFENYEKALKYKEILNDKYGIIVACNNLAEIYLEFQDYGKAKEYFIKSLKICIEIGNDYAAAHNYSGIARIYDAQKQFDSALYYHLKALEIRKKINEKSDLAISFNDLAIHYSLQKLYSKAVYNAEKSLKYGTEIGNAEIISKANKTLYEVYEKNKNFEKAYLYYTEYNKQLFANLNNANTKKITELELNYSFDKKQKDLQISFQNQHFKSEKEISTQRLIIALTVLALIFVVIVAIITFYVYVKKREANIILKEQKEEIAIKNEELHEILEELRSQKNKIEIQHEQITSSIRYAKTIQNDILTKTNFLRDFEFFLIFKSKDIVSGDFYWHTSFEKDNEKYTFIAVADSTGHGVPGAFLSIIGHRLLDEIIKEKKIYDLSEILLGMDNSVISLLNQKETDNTDGMEIGLLKIIESKNKINIEFAGAHRSILFYDSENNKVSKIKGDINSIGGFIKAQNFLQYTIHDIPAKTNDIIYLTTDGFVDQNNSKRKKFGAKNFIELIAKIASLSLEKQKNVLENTFETYIENTTQRDDITILAIKF